LIKSGIVIEAKEKYAFVLNDDGNYEKVVAKKGLMLGRRIIYTEEDIYPGRRFGRKTCTKWMVSAAILILAFAFTFGPEMLFMRQVYAVISLDINPSIQYYIDKQEKVLRVEAMNDDGTLLLSPDMNGMEIDEAINKTITKADEGLYIKKDSGILVSAVALKPEKADFAEKMAQKIFDNSIVVNKHLEVLVIKAGESDLKASRTKDISIGKYKAIELYGEDQKLSIDQIRGMKATEIIESGMINSKEVQVYTNCDQNNDAMKIEKDNLQEEKEKTDYEDDAGILLEKMDGKNMEISSDKLAIPKPNTEEKTEDSDISEDFFQEKVTIEEENGLKKEEAVKELENGKAQLFEDEIETEVYIDEESEAKAKEKDKAEERIEAKAKEKDKAEKRKEAKSKEENVKKAYGKVKEEKKNQKENKTKSKLKACKN